MSASHNDRLVRRAVDRLKSQWRRDAEDIIDNFMRDLGSRYVEAAVVFGDRDRTPVVVALAEDKLYWFNDYGFSDADVAHISGIKIRRLGSSGGNWLIFQYTPPDEYHRDIEFRYEDSDEMVQIERPIRRKNDIPR
jgi:hypothetical protein